MLDGRLRVRVRAAPVEGAANASLLRVVAAELGLPASGVALVRGAQSREKLLVVVGVEPARLHERWPGLGVSSAPGPAAADRPRGD